MGFDFLKPALKLQLLKKRGICGRWLDRKAITTLNYRIKNENISVA
jgi:hypothetical protein